jgi:hypothetical protein
VDKQELKDELSSYYPGFTVIASDADNWMFTIEDKYHTRRNIIRLASPWAATVPLANALALLGSLPPCEAVVTREGQLFLDDRDFRPADQEQIEAWTVWRDIWKDAIDATEKKVDELEQLLQSSPNQTLDSRKRSLLAQIGAMRVPLESAEERLRRQG